MAVIAAAAFVVCCVCTVPSPAHADDDRLANFILYSGRDLWRNGLFANGGLLWAPNGIDRSGFLLKAQLSTGIYRYQSEGLGTVYGGEMKGQILPGWGFKRGQFELKLFAGPDLETHRLWPDDRANSLRGTRLGLTLAADLWDNPTVGTMIAADVSFSTIGPNCAARIAAGLRAFDQFYVGPEFQAYGGDGYRQFRFGAHITSLKTGQREWSAAVGWAVETNKGASPYVRLGFVQRLNPESDGIASPQSSWRSASAR